MLVTKTRFQTFVTRRIQVGIIRRTGMVFCVRPGRPAAGRRRVRRYGDTSHARDRTWLASPYLRTRRPREARRGGPVRPPPSLRSPCLRVSVLKCCPASSVTSDPSVSDPPFLILRL